MKKALLFLTFVVNFLIVQAQKVDTVIDMGIYKSHYSYELKEPLYVEYKLYKGGGDCSRATFKFKTIGLKYEAQASDYAHNGYDEGHMANAADFAGNCTNEELTFRFINCLPQTAKLNRGIWKTWETKIRKESQSDTLLIVCGGEFEQCGFIGNHVAVPNSCWKMVISKNKFIHVLWFPNDDSDMVQDITFEELQKRLSYKIKL
jgi:endonuclease G, mitochondrial